jgi:hypothetical protein
VYRTQLHTATGTGSRFGVWGSRRDVGCSSCWAAAFTVQWLLAMDGTLSQMAVAGRDPLLAFARNLGPELRSHRSTGRGDAPLAEQLAKLKGRVKQIQEREERDRRRDRRATRRAAAEGLAPEPEPETEVVSALSARLKWTKSVESRLRQESQALSAKIAREEAERAATVATLTQSVFGPQADMRITGNLAGAESEFGSKLRRGGLAVRGADPERHPTRPGRRGVLHGRRSVAKTGSDLGQRGPSPQAMEKAAELMRGGGRASAPPDLGGRQPIGCLPAEVIGREAPKKSRVPPSLAQSTYVNHGHDGRQRGERNPQHHREWGKLQSALSGQASQSNDGGKAAQKMYDTHEFGKLKGQIIRLQQEAARIDSTLGTRTRVLAVPSAAFPVRADDGPAFSKY